MKLPEIKHTGIDPTECIEHIFGFPRCHLTSRDKERKGLSSTNGNIIIPDKLYIRMGSDIFTHEEILAESNRPNPPYPRYITYTILECEILPPKTYTNTPLPARYTEVEYMSAIIEYCFANDIHIPKQTHVLKFCLENIALSIEELTRYFAISDDHLQILNETFKVNHRL